MSTIYYQTSLHEYKCLIEMNLNRFTIFYLIVQRRPNFPSINQLTSECIRNYNSCGKKIVLNKWLLLIYFFLLRNVILRFHEFRYKLSVYVTSLCYYTGFYLFLFVALYVSLKCIKNSFKIRQIFIKPVFPDEISSAQNLN